MENVIMSPQTAYAWQRFIYRRRSMYIWFWLQVLMLGGSYLLYRITVLRMGELGIEQKTYVITPESMTITQITNFDIVNIFYLVLSLVLLCKFILYYAHHIPVLKQWQEQKERAYFSSLKNSFSHQMTQKNQTNEYSD